MAWPLALAAGVGALANFIGGHQDRQSDRGAAQAAREAEARNAQQQREFAQNGIRWRVDDAKAAGIHPLYALGANTSSFSPISIGDTRSSSPGQAFRDSGQDVSRAISATRTAQERKFSELQLASAQLDLEGKALQNQVLSSQLRKLNSPTSVGPSLPSAMDAAIIPGQGNAVKVKPSEVVASAPGAPARQAGGINSYQFMRTQTGLSVVPSTDAKERTEDDIIQQLGWTIRNQILPSVSGVTAPSTKEFPLPKGQYWKWNPWAQEFQPSSKYDDLSPGPKKWINKIIP